MAILQFLIIITDIILLAKIDYGSGTAFIIVDDVAILAVAILFFLSFLLNIPNKDEKINGAIRSIVTVLVCFIGVTLRGFSIEEAWMDDDQFKDRSPWSYNDKDKEDDDEINKTPRASGSISRALTRLPYTWRNSSTYWNSWSRSTGAKAKDAFIWVSVAPAAPTGLSMSQRRYTNTFSTKAISPVSTTVTSTRIRSMPSRRTPDVVQPWYQAGTPETDAKVAFRAQGSPRRTLSDRSPGRPKILLYLFHLRRRPRRLYGKARLTCGFFLRFVLIPDKHLEFISFRLYRLLWHVLCSSKLRHPVVISRIRQQFP